MSEQETEKRDYPGTPTTSAAALFVIGLVLLVVGAAIAAGGGDGESFGAVILGIGGIFTTIGMIAKGVEIGIRNARD